MNTHQIKILVLDDEPFMLKLIARMLENMGYEAVTTCDNGPLALQKIEVPNQCPDLILLDINMPAMDGIEFVRHLVEHRYAGSLILVSGEDERVLQSIEKLVRAHKIAILGHLGKPVSPGKLAALIEAWVPPPADVTPASKKVYGPDELSVAIANGELVNYYQPKVAVKTGVVVGLETLVRWLHPEDGLLFPDQFIGLAEEHNLIDALTRTVFTQALKHARVWQEANLALCVAVNLSMDNLKSLLFLEEVLALTEQAGVKPQSMVLEVTESRLMEDQRVPLEILTRLHLKRFRLSIDDFGTGSSSLTQLRDIPFDELKIDQSFVHGVSGNTTQRAMFDASLGLAKQLNMESVAEGVEDRADWDFLREGDCDVAQGYFIAKPMLADHFPGWLADWEGRRLQLMPQ